MIPFISRLKEEKVLKNPLFNKSALLSSVNHFKCLIVPSYKAGRHTWLEAINMLKFILKTSK